MQPAFDCRQALQDESDYDALSNKSGVGHRFPKPMRYLDNKSTPLDGRKRKPDNGVYGVR
jgi:hypothetical protein